MVSIEQSVKSQFAKVFAASDWCLFKKVAESNLSETAKLLKRDGKWRFAHKDGSPY